MHQTAFNAIAAMQKKPVADTGLDDDAHHFQSHHFPFDDLSIANSSTGPGNPFASPQPSPVTGGRSLPHGPDSPTVSDSGSSMSDGDVGGGGCGGAATVDSDGGG